MTSIFHSPNTPQVSSRWRRLITSIPVPQSLPFLAELEKVEARSMQGMPPVLWDEAEGFLVRDPFGNQWIDLTSGIVTANAGHAHPRIAAAIIRQVQSKLLFSYSFFNRPRLQLISELVKISPIPEAKGILYSSGTEATECAIALMRRYGRLKSSSKIGIIGFAQGYHGRTLGAALAGGAPSLNDWTDRSMLGNYLLPYPYGENQKSFDECLVDLEAHGVSPEKIAGIIVEPMQGWTASLMPRDFMHAMCTWARANDILVAFDEVQVGCGRTGKFFACQHLDVTPDLICLGKGLASSLPISAVLGRQRIIDLAEPGEMSSTQSGNPVCAAAALACLEVLRDEHLVEHAAEMGCILKKILDKFKNQFPTRIKSVAGEGLIFAIHLMHPETGHPDVELADAVANAAVRRGVLMFVTKRGYLKIVPPLCIEAEALIEAVEIIQEAFSEVLRLPRYSEYELT